MQLEDLLRPIVRDLVREALGQLAQSTPADLRVKAGLTRHELVVMIPGLTEATLSRYETGTITNVNHPSVVSQAKRIAQALGVDFTAYLVALKGVANAQDRQQQTDKKGAQNRSVRAGGNR